MVDLIFKPVKNLLVSLWSNMADLADKIDDLICSFEGGGDTTMDTVAMLIFGWMVCGLFVLAIGKYVYARFFAKIDTLVVSSKISSSDTTVTAGDLAVESNGVTADVNAEKQIVSDVTAGKAKPLSASRAGGKFVPPTPPVRKRITTKKGSGPTPAGPRTHALLTPPSCSGADPECVKWVNELFLWLYSDLVIVNELLNVWIQTINEYAKKSVAEHGVGVEMVRVLPETHTPSLTNVFCECATNDDITITCDCEATPAFQLKALRQRSEKVQVSHYRLNVNRFRARLNIYFVTEKLLADVKCDGWPEVKVALAQVGSIKNNLDEQSLQDVISEIVVTALRNVVVNLNLSQYPTCPRFSRYIPPAPHILPVHYDSMASEMARHVLQPPPPEQKIGDKRLLVKVINAANLGSSYKTIDPYCIVEMDDPPQKNQTSVKKETKSPHWDEHFLFDLSSSTGELLFEVYDRNSKHFLGLGIVGVEELFVNPSQRQTISLQPKPYETQEVTGTITVEFMFIEGADIPVLGNRPYKLKETLRSVTPSGNVITTSKTVFSSAGHDHLSNGGDGVTDSALKELELRNKVNLSPAANKSTLIIHSVQRHASMRGEPQRLKVQQDKSGAWEEVPNDQQQPEGLDSRGNGGSGGGGYDSEPSQHPVTTDEGRGRSRRKKRDFFGTIKRRLGRSRNRSKSVDPGDPYENGDDQLTRSVSADRMRDASAHSTAGPTTLKVPSLRVTDGELSRRSSLSELSGLSGASARTYINEASTLVLETVENGIKKYYLIPLSLAQKSKWRKKGTKLHIFNDHTFIAKHLSSNTTCQICAVLIPRRFGKQGYECRDCLIKCHKACHVKVNHTCPQSTIQSIELSKLTSPMLDKKGLPPISPRASKNNNIIR